MARREPAMVDVHGAVWTGRNEYELVPSAKRYELFEMSYGAKVLLRPWHALWLVLLCCGDTFAAACPPCFQLYANLLVPVPFSLAFVSL